jgi:hypothetical protein
MTDEHLIQIGKITVNFQSLEYIVCWAIVITSKEKQKLKTQGVFESKTSFYELLKSLEQQAESKELKSLIEEIRIIQKKRNEIIHSSWWSDPNNSNEIIRNKGKKTAVVEIRDLEKIATEILELKSKLNTFLEKFVK